MTDHEAGAPSVPTMTGAFIKRPGMYLGTPIRFDRVTAFISGYTLAVMGVRGALSATTGAAYHSPEVEGQFKEKLLEEGRLRWHRWDLTIAAEAIGWTADEPPEVNDFTEQQHRAAIDALAPLLDRMFSLPDATAETYSQAGHPEDL